MIEAAPRLALPFFARDARVVARALIGTYLVHSRVHARLHARGGEAALRVGRVVETEAYCGPRDLACHARVGLTARTRTLLGPPGHAYVFLIYGMHDCLNVTCLAEGRGHAVLLRGLEPLHGFPPEARGDGPGRLTKALEVTRAFDGESFLGPRLYFTPRERRPRIGVSARVGVAYAGGWADKPWRFFDASSAHVSRPSPRLVGRFAG